eukprot:6487643-Amphidinium_carterae.1
MDLELQPREGCCHLPEADMARAASHQHACQWPPIPCEPNSRESSPRMSKTMNLTAHSNLRPTE